MEYLKVSFLTCYSIVLLAYIVTNTDSIRIRKPREELKQELKSLFDGGGALSDFVFFDLEDLQNYTAINGPPRNRTELRRTKKPQVRAITEAESTLSRALTNLAKGKNMELITAWAELLRNALYSNKTTNGTKSTLQKRIFGLSGYSAILKRRDERRRLKRQTIRRKSTRLSTTVGNSSNNDFFRKTDMSLQRVEDDDENEEFQDKQFQDFQRTVNDEVYSSDNEEPDQSFSKPASNERDVYNQDSSRRSKGIVQTMDFERMRRSVSYSYVESETCLEEGADGSTSTKTILCKTCYKTVDFGKSVMPQFANSIECDDSASTCLGGDGTCTQKVVYYTFQKMTDSSDSDTWDSFTQPLNVSCECECVKGTRMELYLSSL